MDDFLDIPPGRCAPLPHALRLLDVCAGEEPTSPLEFAARALVDLWNRELAAITFSHGAGWTMNDLVPVRHSVDVGVLERLVEDEVTWQTGNRPERVEMVADQNVDPTLSAVVSAIASSTVVAWRWSSPTPCPVAGRLSTLISAYDARVADLRTGGPQRRRRSHGVPPLDPGERATAVKAVLRLGETAVLHYPATAGSPGLDLRVGCPLLTRSHPGGDKRSAPWRGVEPIGVIGTR